MVLSRSKLYRTAKESVRRAERFAYRDRRTRKRVFRALWITRISAACRMRDISYSRFIAGLTKAEIQVNRKMLSEVAIHDEGRDPGQSQDAVGSGHPRPGGLRCPGRRGQVRPGRLASGVAS
jgi:ribosomal protein L20